MLDRYIEAYLYQTDYTRIDQSAVWMQDQVNLQATPSIWQTGFVDFTQVVSPARAGLLPESC